VRRQESLVILIDASKGCDLPLELALVRSLMIGLADGQSKVLPSRVRVRDVIDGDRRMQLNVIGIGPHTVISQDFIVSLDVTFDCEGPLKAFIQTVYLFDALDLHRAPIVAGIKVFGHGPRSTVIYEALGNVTKECPENVALVVILVAHDLVETFLAKCLRQDLTACHGDALILQIVLLIKVGRVATISTVRHAVLHLEFVAAIDARVGGDAWGEEGLPRVVVRETE